MKHGDLTPHDIEQFRKAWEKASTLQDAAEKLGLSVRSATLKACYLRKRKGVTLKRFNTQSRIERAA